MIEIIAVVCALGQDPSECQPQTARAVYELGQVSSELACMLQAQQTDARVSVHVGRGEWVKYVCQREGRR